MNFLINIRKGVFVLDDFDDAGMYYADKDFYEKENPERSRNKKERDFDAWLEDEWYELE